jgi:hypothetical protein
MEESLMNGARAPLLVGRGGGAAAVKLYACFGNNQAANQAQVSLTCGM